MSSGTPDQSFRTSFTEDMEGTLPHRRNLRPFNIPTAVDRSLEIADVYDEGSVDQPVRKISGDDDRYMMLFGDLSFSVFSVLTQRLLTHPCLVFRNQCQLNTRLETGYKLMPWSILRPIHSIYKNQGAMALWKGVHNDFMIASIRKSVELVISENSSLPLTLDEPSQRGTTIGTYGKHMLLKAISTLLTAPLICAGHVLRVQSQVVVGDVNYLSIFPEAYHRIVSSLHSHNSETSHMLPIYKLVAPIAVLSLGSYIIHGMSMAAVRRQYQLNALHIQDMEHDEVPVIKTIYDRYYPQLLGALSGQCISDIFFYPLSTITGRLILQGTRTIIDDVEAGNAVLPFTSNYTGVVNCMQTIISEEGVLGLYKGFGALVMQYTVQALVLRGCHLLYERIMDTHYPRVPRQNLYTPVTPSSIYSSVTSLNMKT